MLFIYLILVGLSFAFPPFLFVTAPFIGYRLLTSKKRRDSKILEALVAIKQQNITMTDFTKVTFKEASNFAKEYGRSSFETISSNHCKFNITIGEQEYLVQFSKTVQGYGVSINMTPFYEPKGNTQADQIDDLFNSIKQRNLDSLRESKVYANNPNRL